MRIEPEKLPSRRAFMAHGALAMTGFMLSGATACEANPAAGANNVVYKSPTCGCCASWVKHMTDSGFALRVVDASDLVDIRKRLGAPEDLASCHIARIDGFIVEGHVPADAVRKLLTQRPDAIGVFVPGMPLGSPGMESPFGSQPYQVILVHRDGGREVFASYKA